MKTTAEYLDIAKEKLEVSSDYALSKSLDITRAAVSRYRHNERAFDNYTCMKISNATGIPLAEIITDMELQRETNNHRRSDWENYMKSLGGIAAAFMLGVCFYVTFKVTSPEIALENQGFTVSTFREYKLCALPCFDKRAIYSLSPIVPYFQTA